MNNNPQKIHFLIVEDELEISDIVCLFLANQYTADFTTVTSGNEALELLKEEPRKYNMVVSDFNMANGNGYVVFDYLNRVAPEIPFLLMTSDSWADHPEFRKSDRVGYVGKPFVDETLINEVERLLAISSIEAAGGHQYVPISLGTLANIKDVKHNLFVKINDDKYLRIVNAGASISHDEIIKFKNKGIQQLFVERENFENLIENFKNRVTNEMLFKIPQNRTGEALEYTLAVQEVVQGAVKTFGLSEQTQQLAFASFEMVKNVSEKIPELSAVFEWATFSEQEYTYSHSLLIALLTADVVRALPIKFPKAQEILSMAACFHDLSLENHQVKNEGRFIKAMNLNSAMNRMDVAAVKGHAEEAIEMLSHWKTCPAELLQVIREHHERPDGSGFPQGKQWDQVHELTACFIVCEDLAQVYLELKDRAAVEKYFLGQAHVYRHGTFKAIHEHLGQRLSPHFMAAKVS